MTLSAIPSVWTDDYKIRSYDLDAHGLVSLVTLCNYLQNSAGAHAAMGGLGYADMIRMKQLWVLTRFKIIVEYYPQWDDTVHVETWAKGMDKLFYFRDYQVKDSSGKAVAHSTSSWAVIDMLDRRMVRAIKMEETFPQVIDRHGIADRLEKLPELINSEKNLPYKVRFSDLDLNIHVNNVKYISWILDSFPLEIRISFNIVSFEINFLSEARLNDEITVNIHQLPSERLQYLCNITRNEDKKELCRAKIEWKKR